jgi:hypothetical protein
MVFLAVGVRGRPKAEALGYLNAKAKGESRSRGKAEERTKEKCGDLSVEAAHGETVLGFGRDDGVWVG